MFASLRRRKDSSASRRLPPAKLWLFRAVALVLALLVIELVSWMGIRIVHAEGSISYFHVMQSEIAEYVTFREKPSEALHPYVGWVLNPQTVAGSSVNRLGFADQEFGELRRGPDRVIIAVLGGSVALQMSTFGEQRFRQVLASDPRFAGSEVVLARLALSGYKQPQQLMALNYLLALGAEFDYVVNIDGYNEIALTAAENFPQGINFAYPRAWHVFMINVVDPRESELAFQVLQTKAKRQKLARAARDSCLNWSSTYNLVWFLRDLSLQNNLRELTAQYQRNEKLQGRGYEAEGPDNSFGSDDEVLAGITAMWRNSSLQLHHLSEGNGAVYIHVLQPNQYLPGSKPLSPHEQEKMVQPDQEYGRAVARGYPLLIDSGAELSAAGVRFHDATMLFTDVHEDIYADRFCHYNQLGNDMLAETVARLIIDAGN